MTWTRAGPRASNCGTCFPMASMRSWTRGHFQGECAHSIRPQCSRLLGARHKSSPSAARVHDKTLDRETLVSVLEASATRRDAKGYLQKYWPQNPKAVSETAQFVQGKQTHQDVPAADGAIHVAIAKLRNPQHLDQRTLLGVAKTLVQLRVLGLLSVVVVDCGPQAGRDVFQNEALRICECLDSHKKPAAKMVCDILTTLGREVVSKPNLISDNVRVVDRGLLARTLQQGLIPVVPSLANPDEISSPQPVDAHDVVLAMTRFFTGLQFSSEISASVLEEPSLTRSNKTAAVERIIIIDSLGGIPVTGRPGASHRFVNLDQEYGTLLEQLKAPKDELLGSNSHISTPAVTHAANLRLAKDALSILPSSSSALITTPWAAANTTSRVPTPAIGSLDEPPRFGLDGMVTTRRQQNPLLHNLLTDKPVYSSSLPVQRVQDGASAMSPIEMASAATLLKRGMPLTILPDPRIGPWSPPQPGSARLRLTDNCVDLPRLVYLIEDSFNRKLDVQHYLDRVNEKIAGVIIAGEYEGGAILTWETPDGLTMEEAYNTGRLVPYLDKFAVLKSRQGSGGVADIVFNAMVQDCFPEGLCWRSRKDNPVNKWYFERSSGTNKLADSNWSMFWTTPGLGGQHPVLRDYEAVCRGVEPSWADKKHILD